jgi:predicted DNA-binding transcriptional regulator YafY
MPKGANQKLKLYYLSKIMLEKTDDEHMITMPEIQGYLLDYGVEANRKTLYEDFELLSDMGIEIIGEKVGRGYYYHVGCKQFEIAELKLLVDAIQASKFITEKKSGELIKKLTSFASEYEAAQLKRQVVVSGRVKTMNESIYYFVDDVHRAISENKKITFEYMKWDAKKKLVPRQDEPYIVSPWAMTWHSENYYLIGYDEKAGIIKHFRVDKIKKIRVLDEKRAGRDKFKEFNLAKYTRMNFGMFGGKPVEVKIAFKSELVGVFVDQFGRNITIRPGDQDGWLEVYVEVAMSDQFLGWIFALGSDVKIVGPEDVAKRMKTLAREVGKIYS